MGLAWELSFWVEFRCRQACPDSRMHRLWSWCSTNQAMDLWGIVDYQPFLSRRKTPWCIAKGWWLLCRQTNRLIAIMTFFMTTANFQPLVLGGWICDDEYYGYHGQEQWAGGRSSKNATSVDDNDKKDRRAATTAYSSSSLLLLLLLDPWEYSFFTFANLT